MYCLEWAMLLHQDVPSKFGASPLVDLLNVSTGEPGHLRGLRLLLLVLLRAGQNLLEERVPLGLCAVLGDLHLVLVVVESVVHHVVVAVKVVVIVLLALERLALHDGVLVLPAQVEAPPDPQHLPPLDEPPVDLREENEFEALVNLEGARSPSRKRFR